MKDELYEKYDRKYGNETLRNFAAQYPVAKTYYKLYLVTIKEKRKAVIAGYCFAAAALALCIASFLYSEMNYLTFITLLLMVVFWVDATFETLNAGRLVDLIYDAVRTYHRHEWEQKIERSLYGTKS